jgi:tuberculosinol/isotuberculosinol synthase
MTMDIGTFRNLPSTEVAQLVHQAGSKVCVFPINGTRRWFMVEHLPELRQSEGITLAYLDIVCRQHIDLYKLIFDHGLDTLLTPAFGPDLLERGEEYVQVAAEGLARLATGPDFLEFYQAYGVRVRFYGDYGKYLSGTPYAYLSDLFAEVTAGTASHDQHRLLFGLFAQDAAETIAELAVRYHAEHGCVPDKHALVELYYGEYIDAVDLFIGFDKFCAFDMPLVATGNEDLYFTVSPSPYLTEQQLRDILYDHLYTRRGEEPDYLAFEPGALVLMRAFYRANLGMTLGIGAKQPHGGFWYPLPCVELPDGFAGTPC